MAKQDLKLFEIHSVPDMEEIRDSWQKLVIESQIATPFQTWEWNVGIAKYESDRVRLRVVVAKDDNGKIVGIAPLWIRLKSFPKFAVLEFIGSRPSDYLDLICLEIYREAFTKSLMEWLNQNTEWNVCYLQNLRLHSVSMSNSDGMFKIRPSDICPYTNLPETIEKYELRLPKKLRYTIRHQNKLLGEKGRLTFSVSRTASELRNHLEIFFDLHQRRQRSKGERGKYFDSRWRTAFHEISSKLLEAGVLRLGILWIDSRPAACLYNLRLHDREYYYSVGMEPEFAQHSPGTLLQYYMIREAIKDNVKVYDFGRGNEIYKSWWTDRNCQLFVMIRGQSNLHLWLWTMMGSITKRIYGSHMLKQIYLAVQGFYQRQRLYS